MLRMNEHVHGYGSEVDHVGLVPPADLRASAAPPLDDRAFQDQDEEPAQHNEAGGQPEQSRHQLPSSLSDYDDMMTKPLQEQNKMLENALYETMDQEIDALVAIKDLLYLSSTVYKLQTKVDQLTAHNDECHMMHEGAEKERIESYDALVSGEAVMKLGMETALELYEKEKEANDSLKEKYKKIKESNTQLEAEITEIKDQIHKMEQEEDADMKCDSA
ncbi:Uncharacterized protein DAT39_017390, partial [Clarias magur]